MSQPTSVRIETSIVWTWRLRTGTACLSARLRGCCQRRFSLTKVVIYEAFVEGKLEAPKHLARTSVICNRTEVRRIPVANDLESLECIYVSIQGT